MMHFAQRKASTTTKQKRSPQKSPLATTPAASSSSSTTTTTSSSTKHYENPYHSNGNSSGSILNNGGGKRHPKSSRTRLAAFSFLISVLLFILYVRTTRQAALRHLRLQRQRQQLQLQKQSIMTGAVPGAVSRPHHQLIDNDDKKYRQSSADGLPPPRLDPDGSTHKFKPLQVDAAFAPDKRPKKKELQELARRENTRHNVPKEDEIPFVDPDLHPSIMTEVQRLVQERPEIYKGREQLLGMLLEMRKNLTDIPDETWLQVPVWKDIQAVHGTRPIVHGLDQCQTFRDTVPPEQRHLAVAGMFSTGTNLLAVLLQHNCGIPERIDRMGRRWGHGMEWQISYGKHTPLWLVNDNDFRVKGKRSNIKDIDANDCMVATMIRHPYDWLQSMCRHGYTARWPHTKKNCPHLTDDSTRGPPLNTTTRVKFGAGITYHESIAHMWNDWNAAYYYNPQHAAQNLTARRLNVMIRFEDVIFYPKQLTRIVCGCVGGQLYEPKEHEENAIFHYVIDSAITGPGHGNPNKHRNGLLDGWIKYSRRPARYPFSDGDLEYLKEKLNRDLMETFHWKHEYGP